jgi:bifunctional non-homologous end joining protein LigD
MTTFEIDGRTVRLTNLDKVLWPDAQRTKAWMLEYYLKIAPTLLPYVERRPVTLRRFPDGVDGPSWHQNECRGEPEWFHVFETAGRGGRTLRFCVIDDVAALLWAANQGAIEVHPFQWQIDAPRLPTGLVFDLDPGADADLVDCARVALLLRAMLDELGLTSFASTSGSLGLHLRVPLGTPHDGEHLKAFARGVAEALASRHPDEVVAEMDKRRRVGRVFVDWLQNDPTRQTVAPYSLRGGPLPTVATPVDWDEVEAAVDGGGSEALVFLADDVLARIDERGDLLAEVLALRQELPV